MAKRPWAKLHIQTVNYGEILGVTSLVGTQLTKKDLIFYYKSNENGYYVYIYSKSQ